MDPRRLNRLLDSLHSAETATPVLRRLCRVGTEVTGGVGVGLSKLVDGSHEVVEASDSDARAVEQLQVTHGQGPCLDAIATFRPSLEPDLTSGRAIARWPQFARGALEQGIAAAYAFPLITGGVAIGALDVYSARRGDLADEAVEDVLMLADLAALAIDQGGRSADIAGLDVSAGAAEPWAHPAVVHNASGMISEQLDIGIDEALLRLRASAFVMERPLADLAVDIVARKVRLEAWTGDD